MHKLKEEVVFKQQQKDLKIQVCRIHSINRKRLPNDYYGDLDDQV